MMNGDNHLKGNRGEWGEAYAFCYILGTGKITATDDDLIAHENQSVLVKSVTRQESPDRTFQYEIDDKSSTVSVIKNGLKLCSIPQSEFESNALVIFESIKTLKGRTFEIPKVTTFLKKIGCHKLKPSDTDKPDITVRIYEPIASLEYDMKYSVKCMAGSRPALVNSSGLTHVQYELIDFTDDDYNQLCAIPQNQVKKRVEACKAHSSSIRFAGFTQEASTFKRNLARVHPYAETTLGYMILESYTVKGKHSRQILERVKRLNPLNEADTSLYDIAFRQYLWAVFCGMVPSIEWHHKDTVDGFLLINAIGDVLSYPIVKRGAFEEHLVDATCFDTPSTSKKRAASKTGSIYKQNGKYHLSLNLLIRYDANSAKAQNRSKVRCIKKAPRSSSSPQMVNNETITFGYH